MGDRKKSRGLDYTPKAFPGARAPDGPASDLEEKLAHIGLLESADKTAPAAEYRRGSDADSPQGRKKGTPLDYTPRAFHGARAPDGLAADAEARLVQMGIAEPITEKEVGKHRYRDTRPPPSSVARSGRLAGSPISSSASRVRDEEYDRAAGTRSALHSSRSSGIQMSRERVERAPEISPSRERTSPLETRSASPLPRVPPEAEPRPLPAVVEQTTASLVPAESAGVGRAARPPARASRPSDRLRRLPVREDRVRLSVRLAASVDEKLDDLAQLRGLDRNTAVSVAIVQDWVACFGNRDGTRRG
jgi:hypothetical protein